MKYMRETYFNGHIFPFLINKCMKNKIFSIYEFTDLSGFPLNLENLEK